MGDREFGHAEVKVSPRVSTPAQLLNDQLSLNGGSTAYLLNVDGSSSSITSQKVFRYIVPAAKELLLEELLFEITDAAVEPGSFGGIAALTTGCGLSLRTSTGGILRDLAPRKLKKNTDFLLLGGGLDIEIGTTEDIVIARYNLADTHGFITTLSSGQYVEMVIDDDLTGLSNFEATVAGRLLPT